MGTKKRIYSGILFMVTSILFGIKSTDYDIGTAQLMGPGYYPLMVCALLFLCGLITLINGVKK